MKTITSAIRVLTAALVAALAMGGGSRAAEPTLPDLLPAGAIVCLVPPSDQAVEHAYQNSVLRALANMPEMSAFFQSVEQSRQEFATDLAATAGIGPDLSSAILNGRLGGALLNVTIDREGKPVPEFVVCLSLPFAPDRAMVFQAVRNLLNRREIVQMALESQGVASTIPIKSIAQEESVPGYPPMLRIGPNIRVAVVGRMILFYNGHGADGIRVLFDSLANPQAALSRQPLYQACLQGAEATPDAAFTFVNMQRLLPILDVVNLAAAGRALDSLGLSAAQGIGLSGGYRGEGIRHNLYIHSPDQRSGILASLSALSPDMRVGMEAFGQATPSDAGGFAALRLDIPAFLNEIPYFMEAVRGVSRPGGVISLLADETVLGVPVGEIARLLGGDLVIRPHDDTMVFLFNNVDVQGFEQMIAHMEETSGSRFRSTAVGNYVVRYFNQRSGLALPAAPAFCLIPRSQPPGRGALYAASFPQAVASLIQDASTAREPLADNPDFRRAVAGLDGQYSMFYYADAHDSYRRVYNTILPIASLWAGSSHYPVDTGLLPTAASVVPKLFGVAVGVRSQPQGVAVHAYSPVGIHGLTAVLLDRLVASNPLVLAYVYAWVNDLKANMPAW